MKIVYDIRIRARSLSKHYLSLGIAENWDSLKTILYALLEVLRPDDVESVIITPLEIEEQEKQA